jgi:hypothetical protein
MNDGFDALPELPQPSFGEADRKKLEEIRQLRRDDFQKYENDKQLQGLELDLLEAQRGLGGPAVKADARPAAPQPQAAPPTDRLQAIREMRRNDWHAYESNPAIQAEELNLIEQQIASRPAEPSTPVTTSQPAAEAAATGATSNE